MSKLQNSIAIFFKQALIVGSISSFYVTIFAQSSPGKIQPDGKGCARYNIHGWIEKRQNQIWIILHSGSRSETAIELSHSLQNLLEKNQGSKIEIEASAKPLDDYLYKICPEDKNIKVYPFSGELKDKLQRI